MASRTRDNRPSRLCGMAIALGCVAAAPVRADEAEPLQATLIVELRGLRSNRGKAVLALFNGKAGFPRDAAKAQCRWAGPIKRNRARVTFGALTPGRYAVSVFHDENGNGRLDKTWLGAPDEGIGASRDARGTRGPPRFKDAAFRLGAGKRTIKIKVRY